MNAISLKDLIEKKNRHALVVSSSIKTLSILEKNLISAKISILPANSKAQAIELLSNSFVSYIFIDADLKNIDFEKFVFLLRENSGDQYVPIIMLAPTENGDQLSYFISIGCDDVLFKNFTSMSLNAKITSHEKIRKLKKLYKNCKNEQIVAQRILANAISERGVQLKNIELLKKSKLIFSGDLFITARHPDGSLNVIIADFTGHGLSAAISGLPVADVFSAMTEKGFELDYIIENINAKLHTLLPTYMFMACSILNISNNLSRIKIWNGGMPDIYIRENLTGKIKYQIKSSNIALGIAKERPIKYKIKNIEIIPGDQIILFTDGLTEASNEKDEMFGEHRLEDCLRNNTKEESIFTALLNTFNGFCGDIAPMDDVTLACIPCTEKIMCTKNTDVFSRKMQHGR